MKSVRRKYGRSGGSKRGQTAVIRRPGMWTTAGPLPRHRGDSLITVISQVTLAKAPHLTALLVIDTRCADIRLRNVYSTYRLAVDDEIAEVTSRSPVGRLATGRLQCRL
ncbi:hypothetical protein J6590_031431 [Homalodisca vitripennis]|nr:hypothetical protein J6590_031431 [Homalodisca vitripennis]